MKDQTTDSKLNFFEEILRDTLASLVFSTVVTDAAGAAVIHVDSTTTNQLVISVTNQTSTVITISKLTGKPSSSNFNITLKLPNDELYFYDAPTIDGSSAPGTWALATNVTSGGAGYVSSFYLANTGTSTLQPLGKAGDTLKLVINYSSAVPDDPKALNIPVIVGYQNIINSSDTPISGSTPAQTMGLMADAGRPSPIVGSFVGPSAVLNDGTTKQSKTLRIINTSLDPLQLIVPPTGQPTQSFIEVILPISDTPADEIWALADSTAWNTIQLGPLTGSASTGWSATKSTTTIGVIKLEPDFTKVKNIPPGGVIELQLNDVISGYAPGVVQVQVGLNRFALIGTQTFGVALEKSPLIYNDGLGAGVTLAAGSLSSNTALNISGDSSGSLAQINQSGAGSALKVSGGDVNLSDGLTAASATISGAASADSISSKTATISGNMSVAGTAAVAGAFTADSAALTANITAGSATIGGAATADSLDVSGALTAGSAAIPGGLNSSGATVLSGTVQALGGAPQALGSGTFTAPTDGFVVATINNTGNYSKMSTTIMALSSNGVTVYATGGNSCKFLTWGSRNTVYFGPLQTSSMLPVSKGASFSVSVTNFTDNQINPTTNTFWVPIGSGTVGQVPTRTGEAPPISEDEIYIESVSSVSERPADIHDLDISDLTGVLDEILGEFMNDDQRVRLQDSIRRIVYWETMRQTEG